MAELRVWLIRHGESDSNVGGPSSTPGETPLTAIGHRQAAQLARAIPVPPGLIVSSPYWRARQTAQPAMDRFPGTPSEVWPVQEFTHLGSLDGRSTTVQERRPYVQAYWNRADPDLREGGAESFADLVARVRDCLARLGKHRPGPIMVFTHENFIKCVMWVLLNQPGAIDRRAMLSFREFHDSNTVANCTGVELRSTESGRFVLLPHRIAWSPPPR
ncbi:histidine phosphatase family protein [Allokutzneria sp. A3M-2-11 16]|uniref:histidine phosphatase family protein n=1 Tax=Allokutzneria sp. A3M-2-11 16 TaxID=2962043 RepID=UPI0020B80327|nr:histidine phosphatase family protein [Allokutzneria sp. A3M-2-11 16]MCP3802621.1 histidine phosphatase family protein [Allokutzneria sp. A3M-2-11 16]